MRIQLATFQIRHGITVSDNTRLHIRLNSTCTRFVHCTNLPYILLCAALDCIRYRWHRRHRCRSRRAPLQQNWKRAFELYIMTISMPLP